MGKDIEHYLNWQIVNLKVGADDLHDSPILYISGNKELTISEGEIATLRSFAEGGGLILASADCASPLFTKSMEHIASKMFPNYPMRELPPGHVIYTGEQFNPTSAKWKTKPKLLGVSNGVRELMLLVPEADLSRAWQGHGEKTRAEVYQLAADIFLYAVDKKNLAVKGETFIVKERPDIKPTRAISLARLQIGENWNPEPGGWRRLSALLHNLDKVTLTVTTSKGDPASLKGVKIAHLTGVSAIKLTDENRKALKSFVETGGTLIVDAAGGSSEFAESIEPELKTLFGGDLELVPPTSPVFTLPFNIIDGAKYRLFGRRLLTGSLPRSAYQGDLNQRPSGCFL